MIMEFLFSAAVGSGITYKLLQRMDKVQLEDVEKMYQQACDCHLQGNCKEAISILENLIKMDRLDPRYYIQLWCSYGKLATIENMKENTEKALEAYEIVQCLVKQGAFVPQDILKLLEKHTAEMKALYDELVSFEISNQAPTKDEEEDYYQKAALATEAGNHIKALQCFTVAIELETDDFLIALYHIKRALTKAFLGDDIGAIQDFNIALKCKRVDDEGRGYVQTYIKDLRKIDKLWRKELSNKSNAIRQKSGDLSSNICALCGGTKNLLVKEEMTICNKCQNIWWDKKSGRVKAYAKKNFV